MGAIRYGGYAILYNLYIYILEYFSKLPEFSEMKASKNETGQPAIDMANEKTDAEIVKKLVSLLEDKVLVAIVDPLIDPCNMDNQSDDSPHLEFIL